MKRREFLEVTALTSTIIIAGGLLNFTNAEENTRPQRNTDFCGNHQMSGGRCSDYRMMEHGPDARFEREIFGV